MRARLALLLVLPAVTGCIPVWAGSCLVYGGTLGVIAGGGAIAGHSEKKREYDQHWNDTMAVATSSSDGALVLDVRSLRDGPRTAATEKLLEALSDYARSGLPAGGTLDEGDVEGCMQATLEVTSDATASPAVVQLARTYGARCSAGVAQAEREQRRKDLDRMLPVFQQDLVDARQSASRHEWLFLIPRLDDVQTRLTSARSAAGDAVTAEQATQLDALQHGLDDLRAGSLDGAHAVAAYDADPRVQQLENDRQLLQAQLDLFTSELGHDDYVRSRIADPSTSTLDDRISDLVTITGQLQAQIAGDDAELNARARALGAMP